MLDAICRNWRCDAGNPGNAGDAGDAGDASDKDDEGEGVVLEKSADRLYSFFEWSWAARG